MLDYSHRYKTLSLTEPDVDKLRADILGYFQQIFKLYESLFTNLKPTGDGYYKQPNKLRHPLIFYLGHTATFFVNKMVFMKMLPQRVNEKFESMFAIGVDENSWDDLDSSHYDWPSVQDVLAYRDSVYNRVSEYIRHEMQLKSPIRQDDPAWIILMGIEHEQVHLETSAVLIREHDLDYVAPQTAWAPCPESGPAPENEMVPVVGGSVTLHKQTDTYGWDNEFGEGRITVPDFKASKYVVTNGEFLQFMDAGGYKNAEYWSDEGWKWCQFRQAKYPYFWRPNDDTKDGGFRLRNMTSEMPLPLDWPAELNYYEAKAFCNYMTAVKGKPIRLPSEAEWRRIADTNIQNPYPKWANDGEAEANVDLSHWASSCPVTKFKHGDFYDVTGNVWQWTETPLYGFKGFMVHTAYDDFSVPTFDDEHMIFKGGSWVSCGNQALFESRFAFRKHFFQCAGIRYIESEHSPIVKTSGYDSNALVAQYLEFHYGLEYYGEKNFMVAIPEAIMARYPENLAKKKCLDLGCAVGRASFELSKSFDEVVGVDFSARFIQCADKLSTIGKVNYKVPTEGVLYETREFKLESLGTTNKNIRFIQGDACNLHKHLTGFDMILAANLIDRLYDPAKFLREIKERLNPNGLLAICSPYTWLEEFTDKDKWIGGYEDESGHAVTTLDGLKSYLKQDFSMISVPVGVPFVIRETARKYQHSVSELTLWQLRGSRSSSRNSE